ncbi:UDP-glucose dehydrogenase family protein [Rhodococcus pyridinivorans]
MTCRISVLGVGYLGATHAACMAELGHEVMGVDTDPAKLSKLAAGEVPFYEPELSEILQKNISAGRLTFTSSYDDAAAFADVHFIAVGTPQKTGELAADLTYVDSVIDNLVPRLRKPTTIFGKSTVPVGTAERLGIKARELAEHGHIPEVAWNPEFLREGYAVKDTLQPDRLVVGVDKNTPGRAIEVAKRVYSQLIKDGVPFVETDLATAELVKTSANAFLATKISFINAMAEICEVSGADVTELADAIGYDTRIGRRFLNAGIGFGGGCLPKDIRAFMARAGELGVDQALTFLREVDNINMRRRTGTVDKVRTLLGGSLVGAKIAVLGAAFKPESDDVRDSPALNIAGQAQLQGATVTVYDPKAMENSRRIYPTLIYASSVEKACEQADAIMVLTEWREFNELEPSKISKLVRKKIIVDGRNCLDAENWIDHGWYYYGPGRSLSGPIDA